MGRAAAGAASSELITIFEGRRVDVPVPLGWTFEDKLDPKTGIRAVVLKDPKNEVQLDVSFLPDPEGRMGTRQTLEDEARRLFSAYLSQAVETEVKLTSFNSRDGIGVYASFTDRTLDPKHIPEGEKLMSTTGIRSWSGAYLLFTLLANSADSASYKTALQLAKSGISEVKSPVGP
jgi:hypothetical protein